MAEQHADFWQTMPKWSVIVKHWLMGEDRLRARLYLTTNIVLSLLSTMLLVRISYAQRNFSTALSEKNVDEFYATVWHYVAIIAAAVPLFALQDFVEERLVLAWRAYLTDVLCAAFFRSAAYYRVVHMDGVDNPDQRISQDVAAFVADSTVLGFGVIQKACNCAAFVHVLWTISPRLVVLLLLYTGAGTWVTTAVFGRKLMSLQYMLLKLEADMRFALVRVREHCEAIAFFRGHASEAAATGAAFDNVVRTRRLAIMWTTLLSVWRNAYTYSTLLVPSLITAPQYFAGAVQFGVVTQASYSFARIENALSFIVASMERFSSLATGTERLHDLFGALDLLPPPAPRQRYSLLRTLLLLPPARPRSPAAAAVKDKGTPPRGETRLTVDPKAAAAAGDTDDEQKPLVADAGETGGGAAQDGQGGSTSGVVRTALDRENEEGVLLRISALHVRAPSLRRRRFTDSGVVPGLAGGAEEAGYLVADGLALTVMRGMTVLLMGPSGCGKSSLLRVIAGLWTHGSGDIACVEGKDSFFLPQKPYMPLGSLRQQLIFPQPETMSDIAAESDTELRKLASQVCLPRVADPATNLSAVERWGEVLSVGEQQRVAFLRLLRAAPALAFLDEATSAMDGATEDVVYSALRARCASFVSVGHRPALERYHSHVLQWAAPGQWRLRPSEAFVPADAGP
eukprot:jgi/Ulvmu1/6915/UM031_0122.1